MDTTTPEFERETHEAEQEAELMEWERAELEREALREAAMEEAAATGEELMDPFDFEQELPEQAELELEDIPF